MAVRIRYFTDPACPWSWGNEPNVRRLMVEFGDSLSWSWVMGGLARSFSKEDYPDLVAEWLEVADRTEMPLDPLIWREGPLATTYPACIAVKAACEQGSEAAYRYLRALREGILCLRRKLDTAEALVEEARRAGLDVQRFRIDLDSHAMVEAFGRDLDLARDPPEEARRQGKVRKIQTGERVALPSAAFIGEDGSEHWVLGPEPYEAYAAAARAAGAQPLGGEPPSPLEALRRFGSMATRELQEVCDLPAPRAHAKLWELACDWRVKPVRVLTGHLWEAA